MLHRSECPCTNDAVAQSCCALLETRCALLLDVCARFYKSSFDSSTGKKRGVNKPTRQPRRVCGNDSQCTLHQRVLCWMHIYATRGSKVVSFAVREMASNTERL
jgi:hypothetical protein